MTVSGTTAFNLTVSQLVTEARALLGIQDAEEPLQAYELQQGIRALNMMIKAWQIDGPYTWTFTEGQFTLVQNDVDYVFGAGGSFTTVPLEIMSARISRGGNDLPMLQISREEYYNFPNKTTAGYPTQFYYDRQRDGGTFYVWPAPDAGLGTIKFTYRRIIDDAGDGTNTMDFPPEWHEALTYGLAQRLLNYYPNTPQMIVANVMQMAVSSYAKVAEFDAAEGQGSIMVTPWWDE